MPVAVTVTPSREGTPSLWGLRREVLQWPEDVLQRQPFVLSWEQSWKLSMAWLELLKAFLLTPSSISSLTSITEEILALFRRAKELQIRVPAPDDVWQYFEKHPQLIEMTRVLLELASEKLPDASLSLEISRDPEEDEEYVVLYARFHNYDETTMKRIRNVREKFLSNLGGEEEWPLLTTDFRSP